MKSHRDSRRATTHLLHRAKPARDSQVPDSLRCEGLETFEWHSEDDHVDNLSERLPRSLRPSLLSSPMDGVLVRERSHAQFVEKTVLRRTDRLHWPAALPATD